MPEATQSRGRNLCLRPIFYPWQSDPLRFADELYFNFLPQLSHFHSVFLPLLKPTAFHTIVIPLLFVYLFNCFIMAHLCNEFKAITYQKRKFDLRKSMDYREILTPFPMIESCKKKRSENIGHRPYNAQEIADTCFKYLLAFACRTFSN